MSNIVRKLTIGKEFGKQLFYAVGAEQNLKIDGETKKFTVSSIDETEKDFLIYLEKDGEIQLWKKQPKHDGVSPEYKID